MEQSPLLETLVVYWSKEMAKKKKIDNSTLKRLYRKASQESRLFEVRDERQYFLIVCEGEKTEPGYFESLKSHLPNGILTINIIGAGDNTLNLVDIALGLREEAENQAREDETQRSYDQIWVVFDKDSFPAQRLFKRSF